MWNLLSNAIKFTTSLKVLSKKIELSVLVYLFVRDAVLGCLMILFGLVATGSKGVPLKLC